MTDRPVLHGDHVVLIDGSALLYRSFYSAGDGLTRPSDGMPVGAVLGVVKNLWRLMTVQEALGRSFTHMAVLGDTRAPTFRHAMSASYKAHRKPPPDDLTRQRPYALRAAEAMGLQSVALDGFEADDLAATYTRLALAAGADVTLVGADKDWQTLVQDPCVTFLNTMARDDAKRFYNEADVAAKFCVRPHQLADLLALTGDASDGIEGIPGIGAVLGAKLINHYGDLEAVLAETGTGYGRSSLVGQKRAAALVNYADQARLARRLIQLDDQVPVPLPLEAFGVYEPDRAGLLAFVREMELDGFAAFLQPEAASASS